MTLDDGTNADVVTSTLVGGKAASGPVRHILPDAENRRIFETEIVREHILGPESRPVPDTVFLVGQPGAGKTDVAKMLTNVLEARGGFVDIDSDKYKPHHPNYRRLMAQDDTLMTAFTGPDGRKWMARAEQYVRENRLNAMVQEIAQNPEYLAGKMQDFLTAGSRVRVSAMAVPEALSNQGILNRYHDQVKKGGSGRLTVQAKADESYRQIPRFAQMVEDQGLAHEVEVFRRSDTQPLYRNTVDDRGVWRSPPGMRAAIETERVRPWAPAENHNFVSTQSKLYSEMGPEWHPRLSEIDHSAHPLMSPAALESLDRGRTNPVAGNRISGTNANRGGISVGSRLASGTRTIMDAPARLGASLNQKVVGSSAGRAVVSNIKSSTVGRAAESLGNSEAAGLAYRVASSGAARAAGKTLGVAGVGLSAYDDLHNKHMSVAHTVTREGVGLGASIAAGAAIGTAIPVPVVGTLAGAAVGAAVGLGASKVVDKAFDSKAGKAVDHAVSAGAHEVGHVASEGAHEVGHAAAAGWHKVKSWFAEGGDIKGHGSSIGDKIPAFLSDGEFVVNAASASANRPLLKAINDDPMYMTKYVQHMEQAVAAALTRVQSRPNAGGEHVDQSMTVHISAHDVHEAFAKARLWQQRHELVDAA